MASIVQDSIPSLPISSTSTSMDPNFPPVIFVANVMRAFCLGYAVSTMLMCLTLTNPFQSSEMLARGTGRSAIIPFLSALFLTSVMSAAILIDFLRLPCAFRAVSLYIFIYLSQICLEIYQTNRVRLLSQQSIPSRIIAYLLFILRATSLCVLLFFYGDLHSTSTRICGTIYPFSALLVEKSILVFYNLGNLTILLYLITNRNPHIGFKGLISYFLFQDGLTFVLSLFLEGAYLGVVATATSPYMMTTASSLASGANMLILHIKYCNEIRVVLSTLVKQVARGGGPSGGAHHIVGIGKGIQETRASTQGIDK
ncbi:hypothetical protein BC829DRAFT_488640 [Chytridium lagenaria]|nr:hypothetical protein BC829DRAFT_488640 [Chytridium lagenaria]